MARKAPHYGWWGVLAALGLVALLLALAWLRLPLWAERLAARALREHGVEVRALQVERIGLATTRLGAGDLRVEGQGVGWESVRLEYRPGGLLAGRLERVAVWRPELELDLPLILVLTGALAEERPAAPPVWESPARIPLRELVMRDGRLRLILPGGAPVQAVWEAQLLNHAGSLDGHLALEGEGLEASLSLRASGPAARLTAAGAAELGPLLQQQLAGLALAGLRAPPELVFTGLLTAEALYEVHGDGAPRASFQGFLDGVRVILPDLQQVLRLDNWEAAGTLAGEDLAVHGGMRVGPLAGDGWHTEAFGARLTLATPPFLRLETEAFAWQYGGWSGRCALRGRALLDDEGGWAGAVEAAFAAFTGPVLAADSFSVHVQADPDAVALRFSPLGLVRSGTLWIEDGAGQVDLHTGATSGAFTWYNTAGALMGTVTLRAGADDDDRHHADITLAGPAGDAFLSAGASQDGGRGSFSATGTLPAAWLNALNRWWGAAPLRLSGPDPRIDAFLEGSWPLLRGTVRLALPDAGIALDNGATLEGVEADWRFRVNGLPASDGLQTLRVRSLRSGELEIRDLFVAWRLPTIRRLEVSELTARLAGGRVRAEPFSMDPLEPVLDTRLHVEGLPAAALLELLGESRFSLDGPLSGSLRVGWRDGALHLGYGGLQLEAARPDQRFRFVDQAFLRDSFTALGGVPPELRERFLEALLQEGIRIGELGVEFLPAPQPGKVLLRIALSGETRTERLEVPIRGFVINNVISEEDLGRLLGLLGPVRLMPPP